MYYEPATPITLPLGAVSIHRGASFELSLHSQRRRLRRCATRRDATRRVAGLLEQRKRDAVVELLRQFLCFPSTGFFGIRVFPGRCVFTDERAPTRSDSNILLEILFLFPKLERDLMHDENFELSLLMDFDFSYVR